MKEFDPKQIAGELKQMRQDVKEQLVQEWKDRKEGPVAPQDPQLKLKLRQIFWSVVYRLATILAEWRDYKLWQRNTAPVYAFLPYPYFNKDTRFNRISYGWRKRYLIVLRPHMFWIQIFKPIFRNLHYYRDVAVREGMKAGLLIVDAAPNPQEPFYDNH